MWELVGWFSLWVLQMLCAVHKSLHWHKQNKPKPTQSMEAPHHICWCQPSSLCPLMPRAARGCHVCYPPGSAGQPQLCQSSRTGTGQGISHITQSNPMGGLERCSLVLIWRGTTPFSGFPLAALGQTQMELGAAFLYHPCGQFWEHRQQSLLLQGLQNAWASPTTSWAHSFSKTALQGSAQLWWLPMLVSVGLINDCWSP